MDKKKEKIFTKDTILVMIVTFLFQFSVMSLNPLINGYAQNLGASSAFAGVIVSVMSITSMFLRPIAGNLSDRFSKFSLTLIGGILSLVGILGYIFTPSAGLLLIFRLINGIGMVLCTVCLATWLSFLVPRDHVGQAMGYYGLLNATSMALAPFVSINIYPVIGYRLTIGLSAVANLMMIILIQFIGNHVRPKNSEINDRPGFKIIQKDVLPVAVIISLLSIPYFATQADIVSYASERHLNISVGSFFLIYAIVLFIVRIALKNLFDTVPYGKWFWVCSLATVIYLIFLTIMDNNWLMGLAAAGLAIGYGIMFSVSQSTALLLAPMSQQGLASSTFYLGLDIGMAVGPILGGLIANYLSLKLYYPIMLVIIPIIVVLYLKNKTKLNNAINQH